MIDEKGKLFGKINLIDLLIILIIIAAVVFVFTRSPGTPAANKESQQVMISFTGKNVPLFSAEALTEGVSVRDDDQEAEIGILDSFTYENTKEIIVADNGTQAAVDDNFSCTLTINILADGTIVDHGVVINDFLYGIGHTTVLYAGNSKVYLSVSDIQVVE